MRRFWMGLFLMAGSFGPTAARSEEPLRPSAAAPAPTRHGGAVTRALDAAYRRVGRIEGESLVPGTGAEATAYRDSESGFILLVYSRGGIEIAVVANEVIVAVADRTRSEGLRASTRAAGLKLAGEQPASNLFLIRAEGPAILSPAQVLKRLRLPAGKGYRAEANSLAIVASHHDRVHPATEGQWALQNIGLRGFFGPGTADADSDGLEALSRMLHDRPAPARRPIVAVLDSGLALGHPGFAATRWRNPDEIAGNNRDDDANGLVDDVDGWDFVRSAPDPFDYNGHGTHVAGIVAARRTGAELSTWGVAPHALIMPLKVLISKRTGPKLLLAPLFSSIAAIDYAWGKQADIINMSFESYVASTFQEEALTRAHRAGVLLVAAAGNGLPSGTGVDVTRQPVYPCVSPYVLCVGATDRHDRLASFSNYGVDAQKPVVEIAAPGVDILSTRPNTSYNTESGTSMAAPLVAGALAALASVYPAETDSDHMRRLLGNSDRLPGLQGKIGGARRLNLYHALFSRRQPANGSNNAYCSEVVISQEGVRTRRWQNSPYANSGEAGIDGSTYQKAFNICSAQQLQMSGRETVRKVYRLAQDIDWSALGANLYPLGDEPRMPGEPLQPYVGNLYGDYYAIVGLRFVGRRDAALIAHLARYGSVQQLNLRDVHVDVPGKAAAVAVVSEGKIWTVAAEGTVRGDKAGGLVAELRDDELRFSFFAGSVRGRSQAGGLAATATGGGTRFAVIDGGRFEGLLEGETAGGIVAEASGRALIERNNAVVNIVDAGIAGGIAGRIKCGPTVDNVSAEGDIDSRSVAGGLVGFVSNAKLLDSYSTIFMRSSGTTRGGSVGRKVDGQLVVINGRERYECTGTTTEPRPSRIEQTYYDSVLTASAGAAGTARTTAELRSAATYPATWWKWPLSWEIHPGFAPTIKPAIARTTKSPFPQYTGESTPECEPHCP